MPPPPSPPAPWDNFLDELDRLIDEPFEFHCIGGFATIAAYGLPRSTNDLDYSSLVPCYRTRDLQDLAGEGSRLAKSIRFICIMSESRVCQNATWKD